MPSDADRERTDPTTPTPEMDTPRSNNDRSDRRRLTDFGGNDTSQPWLVVNDDVMGGRSLGGLSFHDGVLIFEGEIDTDGGGFSSLRLPLEPQALSPYDRIEFRARPDNRSYMVTFDDDIASGNRRVSHRAPIEFVAPGEWQTISVSFDELSAAMFGRPIDDLPFDKHLATRMGILISDGADGAFRLEIDWIELCTR